MVKIRNSGLIKILENICPVTFDLCYFPELSQLTLYLDEPVNDEKVKHIQAKIMKYIGDNLLGDSYKTVRVFN